MTRRRDAAPRPPPDRPADAHKGQAGRVLCACGSAELPGAAILVARAAQRAGAGLVAMFCLDRRLMDVVPLAAPEAVLIDATRAGVDPAEALERARSRAAPFDAELAGPGLGDDERTRALVAAFLGARAATPLVLDADALNALAGRPELVAARAGRAVLTPHPGEAARLLGREVPRDARGREAVARELARRAKAVVCLKGRGTVVTDGERAFVNPTGNEGMATAGAGDVLAGILVAYLAAGSKLDPSFGPFEAAAAAVYVHGLAGDLAARAHGVRGLVASDLIEALPAARARHAGKARRRRR